MQFPIFPLNGAILFPKTTLPLNIFEKRYLSMVEYALANNRYIGMIQTNKDGDLFNIGCLGKIVSFNETADHRYLISLEGISCFKMIKELKKNHMFRCIDANVLSEAFLDTELDNGKLKKRIIEKYIDYINKNKLKLNFNELNNLEINQLAKFIVMISPFSYLEKQMCLETLNIKDLTEKLLSLLEMYSNNQETNKRPN